MAPADPHGILEEKHDLPRLKPKVNMAYVLNEEMREENRSILKEILSKICAEDWVAFPIAGDLLLVDTQKVKYLFAGESFQEEKSREEEGSKLYYISNLIIIY